MAMIQMVRAAWLSSALLIALPLTVTAAQPVTKITIDAATRDAGYTLERGKLDLGIPAGSLQTATKAWVRKVKTGPALPEHLIALSPVYSFTIQGEDDWLNTPLQFQYQLKGKKYKYDRAFYYYNTSTDSWMKLDSSLNRSARTISTQWGALSAKIVVAADTTDPFGPSKTSDFADFGSIDAAAAIAIDESTGDVLYSYNINTERSMASMTKMMTAYVLFQEGVDLDAIATYHNSYDQEGGSLHVSEGETMTVEDLMNALLVGSANNAAYALVGYAGFTTSGFVDKMNETADELGLEHTQFADPSGLAVGNITTASDYAKLMKAVLTVDEIAEISAKPYYSFTTINSNVFHDFNNTNSLTYTTDLDITGSKTGYIDEALYCLAMRTEADGHSIITVVMGAPSLSARTNETYRLTNWVFDNYQW